MESNSFDHGSDSNSCSEYSLDFQETESSLSSLRALDDTLRCRICFDYFKNCAVTKCSHNYCSVCIRRYMSKKAQCPLCFEEAFESDLRDNKTIDEILRIYSSIKGNLPSCAKDVDPHSDDHPQPPMVQIKREVTDNIPQNEVAESTKETEQEKEWDDVSCPVCFKVTSSQHINTHLEHCPKSRNKDTSRNTLVLRSYCKECTKEECSVYIPPSDERKYMCAFCGCYPTKHLKVDRLKLPTEVDITDSEDCISPIRTVPIVQQTPSVPPCGVNLEACVAPVTVHLENLHSSPSHIHVELGTSNSQDNTLQEQSTKRKRRLPARFRFSSGDDDESSLSLSKRLLGQSFSPEFNECQKMERTLENKIIQTNKESTNKDNHPKKNNASKVPESAADDTVVTRNNNISVMPVETCCVYPEVQQQSVQEIDSPATPLKIRNLEYNFDLKSLLLESTKGRLVLANYQRQKILNDHDRTSLAEIVIGSELVYDSNQRITKQRLQELAINIVDLFPTEQKEVWITLQHNLNGKSVLKGKLITKYYNTRRQLSKCGLIRRKEDSLETTDLESFAGDDKLLWLKNNKHPATKVKEYWKQTSKARLQHLVNGTEKVYEYTASYPALAEPFGYLLLEIDFENRYSDVSHRLYAEFPKLVRFINSKLSIVESDKNSKEVQALLKFNKLFPVVTAVRKTNKQQWRPSRMETQEAFLLQIEEIGHLEQSLSKRREKLSKFGLTVQPTAVVVGSSSSVSSSHVIVDSILYKVENPLKALDVTFKAFHSLHASYPPEAEQLWYFLQRGIYKIKTKWDKSFPAVNCLLGEYLGFD